MNFLDRLLADRQLPMFTLPTLPIPAPRTPAPQPVMPVIGGPGGIGGPAPIRMPGPAPIRMPGPAPIPMPRPDMPERPEMPMLPRPEMPMLPINPEGTLKTLMLERDRLQARLDQLNSRIQQLMQGQGSGFPERKPQEGIGNLLEQILRSQRER